MPIVILFFIASCCAVFFIATDFILILTGKERFTKPIGRIFLDVFILVLCPALYLLFAFEYRQIPLIDNTENLLLATSLVIGFVVLCYFILYQHPKLPENVHGFLLLVLILGIVINLFFMSYQDLFFIFFHCFIILQLINQIIQSLKYLTSNNNVQ